jgi:hypothetical protein
VPSWQRNFTSLRFSDISLNNLYETKRLPSGGRFTSLRIWIQAEFEAEMITRSVWKLFNQIKKAAHLRRLF